MSYSRLLLAQEPCSLSLQQEQVLESTKSRRFFVLRTFPKREYLTSLCDTTIHDHQSCNTDKKNVLAIRIPTRKWCRFPHKLLVAKQIKSTIVDVT